MLRKFEATVNSHTQILNSRYNWERNSVQQKSTLGPVAKGHHFTFVGGKAKLSVVQFSGDFIQTFLKSTGVTAKEPDVISKRQTLVSPMATGYAEYRRQEHEKSSGTERRSLHTSTRNVIRLGSLCPNTRNEPILLWQALQKQSPRSISAG